MALPATSTSMAPPNSPKEVRRSNRRSAHSSTSASKSSGSPSPDASLPPPVREPDTHSSARSAASSCSNSAAARAKRAKDDNDDFQGAPSSHCRTTSVASTANAAHTAPAAKRTKRKAKEPVAKAEDIVNAVQASAADPDAPSGEEKAEEDGGVTRCVCDGLADDDGDAPGFMVQCESCMVWQHGPCMGFAKESEASEGDYYCERCKPEDHVELLKKLQRRQRQSSEKSLHAPHPSRTSRSRSPTHFLKTAKRRNTMNSRDAAYEESLQELLDATAAEAIAGGDVASKDRAGSITKTEEAFDETFEIGHGGRKKRKRADDDIMSTKRKRSASVISERLIQAAAAAEKLDATPQVTTTLLPPPPPPLVNGKTRVRRTGGRKSAAAQDVSLAGEGEEVVSTNKKHPNQYTYRGKSSTNAQSRRAPQSATGQNQQSVTTHEHGTRRNANNASHNAGSGSRNAHNAYYNNMQLPMFTTWGLPDYLAHLQSILPSEVPPPLQIRGATSFLRDDAGAASLGTGEVFGSGSGLSGEPTDAQNAQLANVMANATESLTERGAKVKWPAKRMSVADMNKRVRALVEWVGREQALALDRERRKSALKSALIAQQQQARASATVADADAESAPVLIDGTPLVESPVQERSAPASRAASGAPELTSASSAVPRALFALGLGVSLSSSPSTTKMMEELMEELISFEERFGPGAKVLTKERGHGRAAALS